MDEITEGCPSDSLPDRRVRIVLVDDDHTLMKEVRRLLGDEPTFVIVASAPSLKVAVERARAARADVVLLHADPAEPRRFDGVRSIRRSLPSAKVVVLGMNIDAGYVHEALEAGVAGYYDADNEVDALFEVTRTAAHPWRGGGLG